MVFFYLILNLEPIKDVRTLAFKRYFEASILYRADVKLKITV